MSPGRIKQSQPRQTGKGSEKRKGRGVELDRGKNGKRNSNLRSRAAPKQVPGHRGDKN